MAPPSDVVEIYEDGWKARFFCENSENRIEIALHRVPKKLQNCFCHNFVKISTDFDNFWQKGGK